MFLMAAHAREGCFGARSACLCATDHEDCGAGVAVRGISVNRLARILGCVEGENEVESRRHRYVPRTPGGPIRSGLSKA